MSQKKKGGGKSSKGGSGSGHLSAEDEHERLVEQWKIKNLIKRLQAARGNGTSMISLVIPPKDQIPRVQKMLADEYGTASNIKSRVNRLSVLSAITSAKERLKRYNKVPENGLVIYCGTVCTEDGKEKKLSMHFEPFKAINTSLYLCDNKFHVEPLAELLESDATYGFIVMDGNGCLFGTLSGNTCEVLHKFTVELPKKHGRGGQSAVRFARLRLEKRHNYVRKCAELATQHFLPNGDKPNVEGIVLAGCASFKLDLQNSDIFDPRLKTIVIKVVDTSYGGENGFNQAIELSREALANVKFVREKKLLDQYMEEIARETDRYCYGIRDTMRALEMSAVDKLIVWENLDMVRLVLKHPVSEETKTLYMSKRDVEESEYLKDDTGVTWDIAEQEEMLEWLANHYKEFGASLEFVTDRSQEGAQFVKGFGGIGGLLRYQIDMAQMDEWMDVNEDDDDAWI